MILERKKTGSEPYASPSFLPRTTIWGEGSKQSVVLLSCELRAGRT